MVNEPAPVTEEPQEGNTATPQPQEGKQSTAEPQEGESQNTLSLEEVKKLRSEAQAMRARLKASEAKATELDKLKADLEASKLSETEKLQKQLAELQKSYETEKQAAQAYKINAEVRLHAAQLGFINPDDAIKFLDQSQIVEENGAPSNVEDLLKEVAKERPYLTNKGKASATTTGGATNPARSSSTAQQALSWDIIGQMKADEYNARRPEIQKWISEHPHRYGSGM